MASDPAKQTAANSRLTKAAGGAACAAVLLAFVPKFEGMVLRGYKDPIGIVTACAGHTKTAVLGKPYTREQCQALLIEDLAEHAEGVNGCTPDLTDGQRAAAISFAYNVGVAKYCGSTFARKLNAKDPKACDELSRWTLAGGRELRGLVTRRAAEREICLS
jgi:lysozyme